MSDRPYGHYHVMHGAFEDWTVAEHCEEGWLLPGINKVLREEELEEIGERIPTPDEPWQTVPVKPTDDMMNAGYEATGDCERLGECHLDCHCSPAPKVFRAMLAAAPSPGDEQ